MIPFEGAASDETSAERDPPSPPVGPMANSALSLRVRQTLMCRENDAAPQSPEPARDVILGGPLAGLEKIFSVSSTSTRRPGLSVASKVEGRLIAQPSRLLHVVGDDDNGEFLLELSDKVLDGQRRDRVQRRTGLIHQQDIGLHRDSTGNAQPLLLTTGQTPPGLSRRSPFHRFAPSLNAPRSRPAAHDYAHPEASARPPRCRESTWRGTDSDAETPCR